VTPQLKYYLECILNKLEAQRTILERKLTKPSPGTDLRNLHEFRSKEEIECELADIHFQVDFLHGELGSTTSLPKEFYLKCHSQPTEYTTTN
jgi:hypothetical protein